MADKKRIKEGIKKGAFKPPKEGETMIAAARFRAEELNKGTAINYKVETEGETKKRAEQLGASLNAEGNLIIKAYDTTRNRENLNQATPRESEKENSEKQKSR